MTQRSGSGVEVSGIVDRSRDRLHRRGFTIIELMVVMIVITVVVSILLPAMGIIRDTARATTTQGLMNDLVAAASKFSVDHKRQPGYFPARDMGHQDNENRGLSGAENVMLDLAGGVVGTGAGAPPPGAIAVNPRNVSAQFPNAFVDLTQIGIRSDYFVPPPKHYIAQTHDSLNSCQQYSNGAPPALGHTAPEGTASLPDLVDAWGNPLLVWVEDETAVAPVNPQGSPAVRLVKQNSNAAPPANVPAKFYWASNAAFLRATALGRKGKDQTFTSPDNPHSMIAWDLAPTPTHNAVRSLESVLGNPNFPWKPAAAATEPAEEYPAVPRAPFIVQSAGPDGYYFGSKDRGGKRFGSAVIDYTATFWAGPIGTTRNTDKNGNPTNEDVARLFDDLLTTAAN